MKNNRLLTLSMSLIITLLATAFVHADLPSTSRIKTIRNLAGSYENIYAQYFDMDDQTGAIALRRRSGQNDSGTFWRIRRTHPYRGYHKVYVFESRINGTRNGEYLDIDPNSGELKMSRSIESPSTHWAIRYAGKHWGFDAYVIQNLGHTKGGFDMQFLSVDPQTARPVLTRRLGDTSFWFIDVPNDLPTEYTGGQGIGAWARSPLTAP